MLFLGSVLETSSVNAERFNTLEGGYKLTLTETNESTSQKTEILLPDFLNSLSPRHALEITASFLAYPVKRLLPSAKFVYDVNGGSFVDGDMEVAIRLDSATIHPVPTVQLEQFNCLGNAVGQVSVSRSNLETFAVTAELLHTPQNFLAVHFDEIVEAADGTIEMTPSKPAPSYLSVFQVENCFLNSLRDVIIACIKGEPQLIVFDFGRRVLDTATNAVRPNSPEGSVKIV